MKYQILSVGTNSKLGKRVASMSRSVGPTCPPRCPFLCGQTPDGQEIPSQLRCYAADVCKRYRSVERKWAQADRPGPAWARQLAEEILDVDRRALAAIRFHVGGDFGAPDRPQAGEIDRHYLASILWALRSARRRGARIPMWLYTHMWETLGLSGHVKYLRVLGVQVFASVHSTEEADRAAALGFRLAVDPGPTSGTIPTMIRTMGRTVATCPHQRGKVPDCSACKFCFRDVKASIVFVRH